MICLSLAPKSIREARRMLAAARVAGDLAELRIERLTRDEVAKVLEERPLPVIVTCRGPKDRGTFAGTEAERIGLLNDVAAMRPDYIDVETGIWGRVEPRGSTKLIRSFHDFGTTPDDLTAVYRELAAGRPDVVKIATMGTDPADCVRMWRVVRDAKIPTVGLVMGEFGVPTRILGPKFGNYLTFAVLAAGDETAPGQPTADELRTIYRYDEITRETRVYGVIGNPIAHSKSPHIHNRALGDLGLDAVYVPFLVEDLGSFLAAFEAVPVEGYSVTIPHKETALRLAARADDLARRMGAANTLVRRGAPEREGGVPEFEATNTDCAAAIGSILIGLGKAGRGCDLEGVRVALVGAGGAARGVALALAEAGSKLTIYNRTVERAERLAREVGAASAGLDSLRSMEADVLVNSTSVGMRPDTDATPVPADALKAGMVVFDMVYVPRDTRLLKEAAERGCVIVDGLSMFVGQAERQFELFTGRVPPAGCMRAALEEALAAGGG